MKQNEELANNSYVVIRCHDGVIVARLHSFPESGRALMYKQGEKVSFMPLQDDDIVGSPALFTQMLTQAGYTGFRS